MSSTYRTAQKRIHGKRTYDGKHLRATPGTLGTVKTRPCACNHDGNEGRFCRTCSRYCKPAIAESPKEQLNANADH